MPINRSTLAIVGITLGFVGITVVAIGTTLVFVGTTVVAIGITLVFVRITVVAIVGITLVIVGITVVAIGITLIFFGITVVAIIAIHVVFVASAVSPRPVVIHPIAPIRIPLPNMAVPVPIAMSLVAIHEYWGRDILNGITGRDVALHGGAHSHGRPGSQIDLDPTDVERRASRRHKDDTVSILDIHPVGNDLIDAAGDHGPVWWTILSESRRTGQRCGEYEGGKNVAHEITSSCVQFPFGSGSMGESRNCFQTMKQIFVAAVPDSVADELKTSESLRLNIFKSLL